MDQVTLRSARRWLVLAGSGLILVAFILIGVSFVDNSLIKALRWPDDDTLLVATFITIAISAGSLLLTTHWVVEESEPLPREPETTPPIPQAGSDLDHLVANPIFARHLSEDERQQIRDRLRQTTVQTIRRISDVSQQQAEERIEYGEWTENTTAAAFLGQTPLPRSIKLCNRVSDQLVFRHGVRQTARAIVTYANEKGAK